MLAFIIGSILGSFLNVIIVRLPKNQSIIHPRSHCQNCMKTIRFYHNIPILSYLLLKGKCYYCKDSFSIQYPIVELFTAIIFLVVFTSLPYEQAILLAFACSCFVIIGVIDLNYYLIPSSLLLLLYLLLILKVSFFNVNLMESIVGGSVVGLYLFLCSSIIMIKKKMISVIGFGDILLAFFIGGWLGISNGLFCLFLSSIGGLIIVCYRAIKKEDKIKIPFGICLSTSFIIIAILHRCYNFNISIF